MAGGGLEASAVASAKGTPPTPLTPYQKKLLVLLSVASFFEGYDLFALAQILPNLRAELGVSTAAAGYLVGVVNIGTILAWFLVSRADRWGRKRVLTVTIAGYTLASLFTALAPNVYFFALCQLVARFFLLGEWAVAMVYAAEEYPADRRGMAIGVIQACSSLGAIACAGVVPLLLKLPPGWRTVYLVGSVPLVLVALARRGLRETERFTKQQEAGGMEGRSLFHIMGTPYRKRLLQIAAIWALTYFCTQNAMTFWKEFAMGERNLTDGEVGMAMTIAAVASMPLVFAVGKLLDVIGRKRGAVIIFTMTGLGVYLAYTLQSKGALTAALTIGIFGISAVLPVLNAYTTELFPTDLRSDAFAWANNIIGRSMAVVGAFAVGEAAERLGWGPALSLTGIFPLFALVLIWMLLPETRGRELEETSRV